MPDDIKPIQPTPQPTDAGGPTHNAMHSEADKQATPTAPPADNPQDVVDQVLGGESNVQEEKEVVVTPPTEVKPLAFADKPTLPPLTPPLPPSAPVVTPPPATAMPADLTPTPTKMVEPEKKGGKSKVAGVVVGIAILLVAVVGGLFGYAYLTGEPNMIAYIIGDPDKPSDPIAQQCQNTWCNGVCCDRGDTCNANGKCVAPDRPLASPSPYAGIGICKACTGAGICQTVGTDGIDCLNENNECETSAECYSSGELANGIGDLPAGVVKECPDPAGTYGIVTFWCPGEDWESDPVYGGCTQNRGSLPPGATYNYTDGNTCEITGRFCGATQIDDADGASISKIDDYECEDHYVPPLEPRVPTLSCTSLTKNIASPEIGDEIVLSCMGSVVPAGATSLAYDFRYRRGLGEWFDLTANGVNATFTIALAGEYDVQCRACGTIENASVCDPAWIGVGL